MLPWRAASLSFLLHACGAASPVSPRWGDDVWPCDKGAELAGEGILGWEGEGCCVRATGWVTRLQGFGEELGAQGPPPPPCPPQASPVAHSAPRLGAPACPPLGAAPSLALGILSRAAPSLPSLLLLLPSSSRSGCWQVRGMSHRDWSRHCTHVVAGGSIPGSLLFVPLVPVMMGTRAGSAPAPCALPLLRIPLASRHLCGAHPAFPGSWRLGREQLFEELALEREGNPQAPAGGCCCRNALNSRLWGFHISFLFFPNFLLHLLVSSRCSRGHSWLWERICVKRKVIFFP